MSSGQQTEVKSALHHCRRFGPETPGNQDGPAQNLSRWSMSSSNAPSNLCRIAMKDAVCKLSDINDVILVGVQSRAPKVQDRVKEFFGQRTASWRQPG
nr:Hsp70 family protein [Propionivibrio sp.]